MAERDPEGFLRQLDTWEPVVAEVIAADLGIQLTDAHWEVIEVVRRFYQEYGLSPLIESLRKSSNRNSTQVSTVFD